MFKNKNCTLPLKDNTSGGCPDLETYKKYNENNIPIDKRE